VRYTGLQKEITKFYR